MSSSFKPEAFAPLAVSPKKAATALDIGLTRVYELINLGEIESYRDGKSRKVIFASVKAYIARRIHAERTEDRKGWTDRATRARREKKSGQCDAALTKQHGND